VCVRWFTHVVQHCRRGDELPLAYLHVAGREATLVVRRNHVDSTMLTRAVEAAGETGLEACGCIFIGGRRKLFAAADGGSFGRAAVADPHGLLHGPTAFMQAFPRLHS